MKNNKTRRSHLSRLETIGWLLATFNDAREPLRTGAGGGGDSKAGYDSKLLTMPVSWTKGPYKHLEDSLKSLRAADRVLYWHVSERYLRCRSSTITIIVERETAGGVLKEPRRVVVDIYDPKVRMRQVDEAIVWLSENMGPVWLPDDAEV